MVLTMFFKKKKTCLRVNNNLIGREANGKGETTDGCGAGKELETDDYTLK